MAELRETANLLLQTFLNELAIELQPAAIELVTDLRLHQESTDVFSCSVVLKKGMKQLSDDKIYISFGGFPMVKFFGRTWTEFEGSRGIAPFVTVIKDHFAK
jgi:hypothetical protein